MKPANISPLHGAFSILQREEIHSVISGVMYGTQLLAQKKCLILLGFTVCVNFL